MASKKPSDKKLWQSKTFWIGAISIVAGTLTEIGAWLQGLPEGVGISAIFYGAIMITLRVITREAVKVF